jgi:hypothetical protein
MANSSANSYFDNINFVKKITKTSNINNETSISSIFAKKDLNLDNFWKVYNIISKNYYSSDTIKQQDLAY